MPDLERVEYYRFGEKCKKMKGFDVFITYCFGSIALKVNEYCVYLLLKNNDRAYSVIVFFITTLFRRDLFFLHDFYVINSKKQVSV